jgi:cysteine desulfurase
LVFSAEGARLPNTSAFSIPGVPAERLMIALDLGGVAVSSGSACSSGKVGRSHVLEAMGVAHDLSEGAIRVSLGWRSAEADVEGVIEVLRAALERMKRRPVQSAA